MKILLTEKAEKAILDDQKFHFNIVNKKLDEPRRPIDIIRKKSQIIV